jgi:hypothetical protein
MKNLSAQVSGHSCIGHIEYKSEVPSLLGIATYKKRFEPGDWNYRCRQYCLKGVKKQSAKRVRNNLAESYCWNEEEQPQTASASLLLCVTTDNYNSTMMELLHKQNNTAYYTRTGCCVCPSLPNGYAAIHEYLQGTNANLSRIASR